MRVNFWFIKLVCVVFVEDGWLSGESEWKFEIEKRDIIRLEMIRFVI